MMKPASGTVVTLTTTGVSLCNGQWHAIFITKLANRVTLSVQGSTPVSGSFTAASLTLSSEVYVGGVPQESDAMEFLKETGLELQSGKWSIFVHRKGKCII